MKRKYVISVDLGGTKILTALLTKENEIVNRVKTPTDSTQGKNKIIEDLTASIKQCIAEAKITERNVNAISLGVPGTVDPETGIIAVAPNLNIKNFNIKEKLQKNFTIPVLLENDVNLAALGIKKFEFKDKVNNMLVVFVGTGIGGALIFDGHMYRGSSMYAGEIGHMRVSPDGHISSDLSHSEFEAIASRTAIVRAIEKDITKGTKSILYDTLAKGKKIKSSAIAKAIKSKDELTLLHMTNACNVIGRVLGNITTLLNVDTIVLGGGVVEAAGTFMQPLIKTAFKETVLAAPGKITKIVSTKLGDDAALYGGIALAEEFLDKRK